MWHTRLLVLLFCLALLPAHAQTSSPTALPRTNDNKRYSLSGTVVNSITGEPIRRALVNMFGQQQLAVMTDVDGHFEFEGLPRMRGSVSAQKPGYFSDQELSGGRRFRQNMVPIGPDTTSLVIKLVPEAILLGKIVDTDGLPVRGLIVRALTQKVVEGRKQWQQGTIARTDADGAFRISNLMPGNYFVVAGPGRAQAFASGADENSELGYPSVTYPGPSSPLKINAGQQVEANFTIRPEPFYSISGSVSGTSPGGRYFVQLQSKGPGSPSLMGMGGGGMGAGIDPETGTFTIPRVAPGDYTLIVRGGNQDPNNENAIRTQVYGALPITVNRSLMGVTVAAEPMLSIPINVRSERTRQEPNLRPGMSAPRVQISLRPQGENGTQAFSQPENPKDPKSPLVLRNAVPGKYWVEIQPNFGDTYVASARLGTTDLLDGEVTLTRDASQGAIEVVLRDDKPKLMVKMNLDNSGGAADVLVVPDHGVPALTRSSGTGNVTSTVSMFNLRPGPYTVLVFDDIGNLEYTNRDDLEPYLSRGARISLAPGQEATVTPDLIRRGGE